MKKEDVRAAFEKILSEEEVVARIGSDELKGQAMVALVEVEEGTIGLLMGGSFNMRTVLAMLEALDRAKIKLVETMAEKVAEDIMGMK